MSSFQKYIATLLTILVAAIVIGIGYFIFHRNNTVTANPTTVATPIKTTLPESSPVHEPQPQKADMGSAQVQTSENSELEHPKVKTKKRNKKKDLDKCVAQKAQQYRNEMGDPDKPINFDMINEFEDNCRRGK